MEIEFKMEENKILLLFDTVEKYTFDISGQIQLTEFVENISESESLITIKPNKLSEIEHYENQSDELKKLADYIYQIITKFNESYSEIMTPVEEDV